MFGTKTCQHKVSIRIRKRDFVEWNSVANSTDTLRTVVVLHGSFRGSFRSHYPVPKMVKKHISKKTDVNLYQNTGHIMDFKGEHPGYFHMS